MGKKLERVYEALVEGALDGLSGKSLYEFVQKKCPDTPNKRIVKASLLALSDPHVNERKVLEVIYALAIDYRLASLGVEDEDAEDDDVTLSPTISGDLRKRLETSVSPSAIEEPPAASP